MNPPVAYHRCPGCQTIFTDENICPVTENDNSSSRNSDESNLIRLERVTKALGRTPAWVVDFGSGKGDLVDLLNGMSIQAFGVDTHTLFRLDMIKPNEIDAVFMVEVIEHLSYPKEKLYEIAQKLRKGGALYIETTFADDIADFTAHPYVDPAIGHRTILSQSALQAILVDLGFVLKLTSRNVVIAVKS